MARVNGNYPVRYDQGGKGLTPQTSRTSTTEERREQTDRIGQRYGSFPPALLPILTVYPLSGHALGKPNEPTLKHTQNNDRTSHDSDVPRQRL
jgi:hypothetical protein